MSSRPSANSSATAEEQTGVVGRNAACRNCGETLLGEYCHRCGQKVSLRIGLPRLGRELGDQFLGLDFRWLRTLRLLFLQPGELIRGYLDGRRQSVVNPLKLLFVCVSLYTVVVSLTVTQFESDPGVRRRLLLQLAWFGYLTFLVLVPTALWLGQLFRAAKLRFSELYVALCYVVSGQLLLAVVILLLGHVTDESVRLVRGWVDYGFAVWCLHGLFETSWWTALWKGLALVLVHALFVLVAASSLALFGPALGMTPSGFIWPG